MSLESHRDPAWQVPLRRGERRVTTNSAAAPRRSVCVSPAWERAQEQRAEGGCCMTDDASGRELQDRLEDAERRLAAIAEIAAAQVDATGTAEMDLADAESRLNRIHDLARSSP